jgi:ubiquinone/menaquinone biosynthesis C-methylase UbiE
VNADGWPVVRVAPAGAAAPADASASWATLRRLWVLRNSAFSADYDERAYNSLIPLQRYWQRARYRIITGFVDPRSHILDIGCGSSRIVQALPFAVGLDIQLKKLRRISGSTRKLVQATLTRLPFRDGAFETLICSQVIEHVPEPLVDWQEFNRVLAPGGTFVVGTPDYATVAWPLLEYLYGLVHPKGYVNEHINRYTAAGLRRSLEEHGFTITDAAYVGGGELIYRARKTSGR